MLSKKSWGQFIPLDQQEGTKKRSNGEKKNFIPMQNMHDLLVGTLSIGIPSI